MSETGSTNQDLLQAARGGLDEGAVLVTDHQRQGRGRQGRVWVDEPGSSLLTSVLLRPEAAWASLIPLATGLAIAGAVRQLLGSPEVKVGLKWPNDVLIVGADGGERKLCGILAEARSDTEGLVVVVGFGMNLHWSAGPPPEVAETAVDLASVSGGVVDRIQVLRSILEGLEHQLSLLEAGARGQLVADYRHVCLSLGRQVRLQTPAGTVEGEVAAIEESGGMVLETANGRQTVTAGDAHHLG